MGRAQPLHAQPGGDMECCRGARGCQCSFVPRLISRAKSPDVEGFPKGQHGSSVGLTVQPGEVAAFSPLLRSTTRREEWGCKWIDRRWS